MLTQFNLHPRFRETWLILSDYCLLLCGFCIIALKNFPRIRPGMFGRVTVSFGTLRHVVVPDQAIVKRAGSGDRYVYVYKDGKVSYNKVELGRRMGTEYELISGVEDNSQVVVAGQTRLADGVEVAVN